MVAELKPYRAYKDSGVEWLGKVPAHWEIERGKCLFRKMDRPVREVDEVVTCFRDGVVTLRRNRRVHGFTESLQEIGYQGIRRGDLVIHGMDAFAGAIGVADSDGKGTPVYSVCEPRPTARADYYAHALREMARSQWIQALTKGIRERSTDFRFESFGSQRVPHPPLPEQAAIVRFLDHADRGIRRYIRAKEKQIALLEEQKQAIILQSVTGRVDVRTGQPYPSYKRTDAEWLEQVPTHWESRRLKWVTRLQRGYDLPSDQRVSGPFPVVSSGGVIDTHSESRSAGPGVVMGRYGSTDAVFYVEQDFWPHNTSLFVTDFQGNSPRWCYYLLGTITKGDQAGKSAVPGLDRKDLFQIVVPVPPIAEQRETVRAIETVTESLTDAISATGRKISVMHEYESRLVADVVTGKLDVRGVADGLPDVEFLADDELEGMRDTDTESEPDHLEASTRGCGA